MSDDRGWYYLHENGDLIWKKFQPEMEAGGFVRAVWRCGDADDRGRAWLIAIEALAMGARRERIDELAAKWGLTDADAQEFVKRSKAGDHPAFRLFRDGDQWCATFYDFVNVQESQAGFGSTALAAFAALARPGLVRQKSALVRA